MDATELDALRNAYATRELTRDELKALNLRPVTGLERMAAAYLPKEKWFQYHQLLSLGFSMTEACAQCRLEINTEPQVQS